MKDKAKKILDKHLELRSWTNTVPKNGNLYNTILDVVNEALAEYKDKIREKIKESEEKGVMLGTWSKNWEETTKAQIQILNEILKL